MSMERSDILQVLLPQAINIGDGTVGSRQYDLTLYPNTQNYYTSLFISSIQVRPHFAPAQCWVYRDDVELGQFSAQGGMIPLDVEVDAFTPVTFRLFNLSIDTEIMLTFNIKGRLYNAV